MFWPSLCTLFSALVFFSAPGYSVQQHGVLFSNLVVQQPGFLFCALILYSALLLLFSCLVFCSVLWSDNQLPDVIFCTLVFFFSSLWYSVDRPGNSVLPTGRNIAFLSVSNYPLNHCILCSSIMISVPYHSISFCCTLLYSVPWHSVPYHRISFCYTVFYCIQYHGSLFRTIVYVSFLSTVFHSVP